MAPKIKGEKLADDLLLGMLFVIPVISNMTVDIRRIEARGWRAEAIVSHAQMRHSCAEAHASFIVVRSIRSIRIYIYRGRERALWKSARETPFLESGGQYQMTGSPSLGERKRTTAAVMCAQPRGDNKAKEKRKEHV